MLDPIGFSREVRRLGVERETQNAESRARNLTLGHGYRLTGKWERCSDIPFADWRAGAIPVSGECRVEEWTRTGSESLYIFRSRDGGGVSAIFRRSRAGRWNRVD